MKKLFSLLLVGLALAMTSCYQQPYPQRIVVQQPVQQVQTGTDDYGNPTYEVVSNGGQQEVIVYNPNGTQFFMDYILFNSLINNGGWGSVYGRYNANPGLYYNQSYYNTYSSWHHSGYYNYGSGHSIVINNYHGTSFHDYAHSHPYSSSYRPSAYRPSSVISNTARAPQSSSYRPTVNPQTNAYKPAPSSAYKPAASTSTYRPTVTPAPSYRPATSSPSSSYRPSAPSPSRSSSSSSSYRPSGRH